MLRQCTKGKLHNKSLRVYRENCITRRTGGGGVTHRCGSVDKLERKKEEEEVAVYYNTVR